MGECRKRKAKGREAFWVRFRDWTGTGVRWGGHACYHCQQRHGGRQTVEEPGDTTNTE